MSEKLDRTLILLRGVPGSGKSTFASVIENELSICEADKFFYNKEGQYIFDSSELKFAHIWCFNQVRTRMEENKESQGLYYSKIVVSNTFTQEWEMERYFKLAQEYGYRVFSLIVENRHGGENIHNVPDNKLEQMKNRFSIKL